MDKKKVKRYSVKCQLCKYGWRARREHPKQCPLCKRYDWDKTESGYEDVNTMANLKNNNP
jgi:rubrerythrin